MPVLSVCQEEAGYLVCQEVHNRQGRAIDPSYSVCQTEGLDSGPKALLVRPAFRSKGGGRGLMSYSQGWQLSSVQFRSVTQSCPTLCDSMDCSTPGLPVHHQLLEFTQTHAHLVGDAMQPSHPLSSPSPPAFNLSQHLQLYCGKIEYKTVISLG